MNENLHRAVVILSRADGEGSHDVHVSLTNGEVPHFARDDIGGNAIHYWRCAS